MKIQYQNFNFKPATLATIDQANEIIERMSDKGYTLTVRQLYYQFVSKDLMANTERNYKNLVKLMTRARIAGLVSWYAIEDRNRGQSSWRYEEDVSTVFDDLEYGISYDFWERQDYYVEVWVEKDALSSIVKKPANDYKVPYMACKGYLSASEAWRAGRRFMRKIQEGKNCVLIHLGDHDPSGMDMTRDNQKRLEMFSENDVEVRRIALNMDQIEHYSPPPNPAKTTDSRSTGYIEQYGAVSWELDALEPEVIEKLVRDEIRSLIDFDIWNEVQKEQDGVRENLAKFSEHNEQILEFVEGL